MIPVIVFWASLALIVYTYLLYPALVFVGSLLVRRKDPQSAGEYAPAVSMVISIYNEEKILPGKLKNIASLNYPPEKLEVLIGSDGSTDGSNGILRDSRLPNLHPLLFPGRRGKGPVLNDLLQHATGEIVIFSDANTMYDAGSLLNLVRHFSDPTIGAVCGDLRLQSDLSTSGGIGEWTYWKYESIIKSSESRCRTLLGATGGIYALRRSLYEELPVNKIVTDDFLTPLRVVRRGYRVVYEPRALAYEYATNSISGEYQRKVRIAASNFSTITEISDLLAPRKGFVAFALWSHKIIRWSVPFLLFLVLVTSAVLRSHGFFYLGVLIAFLLIVTLGFLGFVMERMRLKIGKFGIPYYFIAMNFALLAGFFKFILKRQQAVWNVVR